MEVYNTKTNLGGGLKSGAQNQTGGRNLTGGEDLNVTLGVRGRDLTLGDVTR